MYVLYVLCSCTYNGNDTVVGTHMLLFNHLPVNIVNWLVFAQLRSLAVLSAGGWRGRAGSAAGRPTTGP